MQIKIHTYQLKLKHTFSISHESRDVMPSLIVELAQDGHSGYGEATETRYYGVTLDGMVKTLEQLRPVIERTPITTLLGNHAPPPGRKPLCPVCPRPGRS